MNRLKLLRRLIHVDVIHGLETKQKIDEEKMLFFAGKFIEKFNFFVVVFVVFVFVIAFVVDLSDLQENVLETIDTKMKNKQNIATVVWIKVNNYRWKHIE